MDLKFEIEINNRFKISDTEISHFEMTFDKPISSGSSQISVKHHTHSVSDIIGNFDGNAHNKIIFKHTDDVLHTKTQAINKLNELKPNIDYAEPVVVKYTNSKQNAVIGIGLGENEIEILPSQKDIEYINLNYSKLFEQNNNSGTIRSVVYNDIQAGNGLNIIKEPQGGQIIIGKPTREPNLTLSINEEYIKAIWTIDNEAVLRSAKEYSDANKNEAISNAIIKDAETLTDAKDYADEVVARLVDSSPETLDTLQELASALGNDPNFATTVLNKIAEKLGLDGGTMNNANLVKNLNAELLDGKHLATEVNDWNNPVSSIFKSSEGNAINAPESLPYSIGITLPFHRNSSIYFVDIIANLYEDKLFFRRHTGSGFESWKTIAFTDSHVASASKIQTPNFNIEEINGTLKITNKTNAELARIDNNGNVHANNYYW